VAVREGRFLQPCDALLAARDKKKLNSEVRVGQNDFPSKFGKLGLVFFTKKQSLES
jgi:hypothetical protein